MQSRTSRTTNDKEWKLPTKTAWWAWCLNCKSPCPALTAVCVPVTTSPSAICCWRSNSAAAVCESRLKCSQVHLIWCLQPSTKHGLHLSYPSNVFCQSMFLFVASWTHWKSKNWFKSLQPQLSIKSIILGQARQSQLSMDYFTSHLSCANHLANGHFDLSDPFDWFHIKGISKACRKISKNMWPVWISCHECWGKR